MKLRAAIAFNSSSTRIAKVCSMSGDAVSKSHKHHWYRLWKQVLFVILLTILAVLFLPSSVVFLKLRGMQGQVQYPNEPLLYPLAINVCRNGNVHECKLYKYITAGHTIESLTKISLRICSNQISPIQTLHP